MSVAEAIGTTRDLRQLHRKDDSERRRARLNRGYVSRAEERASVGGSRRYHGAAQRISARASSPHRKTKEAIAFALSSRMFDVLTNTRRKVTA